LDAGLLTPVAQGVYANGEHSWMRTLWTGVLLGGPHCAVGGLAAARIHGITGTEPLIIDYYVGSSHRTHDGPWRFIRADRDFQGSPPVTFLAQTVIDASLYLTDDNIVAMITDVRALIDPGAIERALGKMRRHPKRALLMEIAADVADGLQSVLEFRYRRDVERAHQLPAAAHQANPTGGAYIDNLYTAYGVIVELDGRQFHAGLAASGDSARDNKHLLLGLVTLRYNWTQVAYSPCSVAREVAAALRLGGWSGQIHRCPRCS